MINNIKEIVDEIYVTGDEINYEYAKAQIESLAKTIWTNEKTISLEDAYVEVEKQTTAYLKRIRDEFATLTGEERSDELYTRNNVLKPLLRIVKLIQEDIKQKETLRLIRDLSLKDTANIIVELGKEVLKNTIREKSISSKIEHMMGGTA